MKKLIGRVSRAPRRSLLTAALVQQPATAAMRGDAPSQAEASAASAHRSDNRPGPLTEQQQDAAPGRGRGARGRDRDEGGRRPRAARPSSWPRASRVEFFDNNKQARVLSILSEFGDTVVGKYGGAPGPLHNQIPEPDRTQDNSTLWEPDFNMALLRRPLQRPGESFKSFYQTISRRSLHRRRHRRGLGQGPVQQRLLRREPARGRGRRLGLHQ